MREDGKIDYVEMPGGGDLPGLKGFYEAAFGWRFIDYGPSLPRRAALPLHRPGRERTGGMGRALSGLPKPPDRPNLPRPVCRSSP